MNNNIEMTFILKSNEIKEVGFGGAAILNTFSFWLMKNKANKKHLHDGYYWTYNSKRALSEIFYFWTERQVRNQIDKLVKNGYIIIGEYNSAKYDRTSWYALTKKAWDLLKLEDINEYNDETIENIDLTKMSEEKESLRQKCQNHLTKMSDGCDQKVNTIPSINTSINTSINKEKNIKKEKEFIDLKFIDDSIEYVELTQENYDKLIEKYDKSIVHRNIQSLDTYITNTKKGKNYKDHYKVLINWINREIDNKKENSKPKREYKVNVQDKASSWKNYSTQRNYSEKDYKYLEEHCNPTISEDDYSVSNDDVSFGGFSLDYIENNI